MPLDSEGLFEVTIRVWLDSSCGRAQTSVQSDIYSLGATLQTLLTGKDLSEPIFGYASPYAQDQEVPAELELLLLQMLDADVGQRPASMEMVKLALQEIKRELLHKAKQ
jgi:hypothetical protein